MSVFCSQCVFDASKWPKKSVIAGLKQMTERNLGKLSMIQHAIVVLLPLLQKLHYLAVKLGNFFL